MLVSTLLATLSAAPSVAAVLSAAPEEILPLADVKAGMKGYGLTVWSGDRIEKFGVEILGVLPNTAPGRSMIVVRVSGLGLEESGIVAGMSGSPVYVDGKLIGALSAGWGFAKVPIGGVTPIEAMQAIDREAKTPAPARGGGGGTGGGRLSTSVEPFLRAHTLDGDERLALLQAELEKLLPARPAAGADLRPLLSMSTSGIPEGSFLRWRDGLSRLGFSSGAPLGSLQAQAPVGGASSEPPGPLVGGAAITALLIGGDLQMGATGTVTQVLPDGRFTAFGHPFLGFGELELPVSPSKIISVLPNYNQSFKIAASGKPIYRMTRDRDSGIAGRTDRSVPLVPVRFRFETEDGTVKTLNWGVAPHPKLMSLLVAFSADAALNVSDPTSREKTLRFRISFETPAGPIAYEDEATGTRAKEVAILSAAILGGIISDNDFEEPGITGVDLSFRSSPGERRLRLLSGALTSRRYAPGEEAVAVVRLQDRRGKDTVRTVRLKVPLETPDGKVAFIVGDGSAGSSLRASLNPVEPKSLAAFARWVGNLVPSNRLFAALVLPARGAATGTATISALPPTMATLVSKPGPPEAGRSDVGGRLLAEEIVPMDRPLAGSIRLEFEVERPRS